MESKHTLNRIRAIVQAGTLGGLCLLAVAGRAPAGVGDSPLPQFADGKASVQIAAIPGVVKRGQLQTDFLCTSFDGAAVDIGVQIFALDGTLLNDVTAGVGALLNVSPGQTVTVGTSGTATFLESTVIPLTTGLQGSARVVASTSRVRCNVLMLDDSVNPPVALSTLAPGIQPAPGALPATLPLPQFANGHAATHAALIPGVVKRTRAQTDVFCTSLATTPIDLGVEIFGPDGTLANTVATGNGAVLNVAPGATVAFGTTGTAAFFETTVINMAGVAQGAARVVSNSAQVICSALQVDSGVTPPTFSSDLPAAAAATTTASMPSPLPHFSDGKAGVAIMTIPGVVKRGRLQTDVLCTSFESSPVDIGVEIFDTNGALLNNVGAGVGAVLNVGPARTVTIGTSGTATFLESTVIPLSGVAQGSARVVASASGVRCNAVIVDDAVSPPVSLATLREGIQPVAGAVPSTAPLPQFADAKPATHAAVIPGVVKRGSMEMSFLCTSFASSALDVGVEVFGPDGTLGNSIASGNGAVLNVAPGATVTIGTTGSAGLLESALITTAGVAQGFARIVSTSAQISCNALMLDAAVTPPTAMSSLIGWTLTSGSSATPTPSATVVSATRTPTPTPTRTLTPTPTLTPTSTQTFTPTPTVVCASGLLIENARLTISRNHDPAGDETFALQGEATLTLAIDPIGFGFRFQVQDLNGTGLFARVVPPGAPPSAGAPGWKPNATATKWMFKDRLGVLASGITKVLISDRSSVAPGRYKFKVAGRKADFQVAAAELPVRILVVLGDAAGQCATLAFNPSGAAPPRCTLSVTGNGVSCH